jgi:hypothetical protein
MPYRLDYVIETGAAFVTTVLDVSSGGAGWSRRLVLRGDGAGAWRLDAHADGHPDLRSPGASAASLTGALDCEVSLSPVTNLMPMLRHGLLAGGGEAEITAARVSVPDLRVRPDGQQ